jgi:hypothetical protein
MVQLPAGEDAIVDDDVLTEDGCVIYSAASG